MGKLLFAILLIKNGYEQLLFRNEFVVLAGNKASKLIRLAVIVFITFLSLSFSKGSYDYLNKKMNNPYTNWVNVKIGTMEREDKRAPLMKFFDEKENRDNFNIDTITGYTIRFEEFYHKADYLIYLDARSIEPNTRLFEKITDKQNLLWTNYNSKTSLTDTLSKESELHYNIIITEDFLKKLGYAANEKIYKIKKKYIDVDIWLNIIAAVKYIPNEADLLVFPNLFNSLTPNNKKKFITKEGGNVFELLSNNSNKDKIANKIKPILGEVGENISSIDVEEFNISETKRLHKFTFNVNPWVDFKSKDIFNALNEKKLLKNDLQIFQKFETNSKKEVINKPDFLAFYFKKLDKVRAFKDTLKNIAIEGDRGELKALSLDVDLAQIESKENFAYVSALTRTISFLLFVLGLFTIVIYLVNLLKTHLNSIKKNLGTYKAFGFSGAKLNAIYFKIILSKLVAALLIAFVLLIALQYSGFADWLLANFTGLDKNVSCISVFNYWNLAAIVILLITTFFFNYQTIKKILNKTPGDLIYNRN